MKRIIGALILFPAAVLGLVALNPVQTKELNHKTSFLSGKFIDQFGQNNTVDWKGKIGSFHEIETAESAEISKLRDSRILDLRDQFQAWKNSPDLKASGYYRIQKSGERWWIIAPNGHEYYSVAIDCVSPGAHTPVEKVKKHSNWLAQRDGEFKDCFDEKGHFSFYVCNLIRKYKREWRAKFAERALKRCMKWGFTGTGNWSEKLDSYPYVSMGPPMWELKNVTYIDGDIADPFEANFEAEVFRVSSSMSKHKSESLLVGYFLDNEMPWWNIPADVLALKPAQACRKFWVGQLKQKYGSIEKLKLAWSVPAKSFDDLRWPDKANSAAQRDMAIFRQAFAERFYSAWYRAMKKADPNHLILGSRIAAPSDDIVCASAKYTDVLSFNHYDYALDSKFDRYYKMTGKPILIGEYDFDSLDAGLVAAFVPVRDQKQRGIAYSYYTENAAAKPYIVGTHYFQYVDEPISGRGDGESSFNGFVSVCDIPYPSLVEAAERSNWKLYEIHAGLKQATGIRAIH